MKINEIEMPEINVVDADVLENYEKAMTKMAETAVAAENLDGTNSQKIRMQCEAVFDCMNTVFGKGAAKKIFGDKTNLWDCISAVSQLADYVKYALNKTADEISTKFAVFESTKQ